MSVGLDLPEGSYNHFSHSLTPPPRGLGTGSVLAGTPSSMGSAKKKEDTKVAGTEGFWLFFFEAKVGFFFEAAPENILIQKKCPQNCVFGCIFSCQIDKN